MRSVVAHDGEGEILTHRILTRDAIAGACHFMDITVMPPGTSVGRHDHAASEEEYYLILSGTGTMSLGTETFSVGPGDLVRNPPGGSHGLLNDGGAPLTLFVFELAVPA